MNLPAPPNLGNFGADVPDWANRAFGVLNRSLRQFYQAIAAVPQFGEATDKFITANGSGAATLDVKNQLAQKPRHLNVTLVRNDLAPDTAVAWGSTWRMLNDDTIRVSFCGLTASTKYRINVEYR